MDIAMWPEAKKTSLFSLKDQALLSPCGTGISNGEKFLIDRKMSCWWDSGRKVEAETLSAGLSYWSPGVKPALTLRLSDASQAFR